MNRSVIDVAQQLADAHRHEDPETKEIYLAEAENEIRLIEVSASLQPTGKVLPFRFTARPDQGIDFPSVIVLLSPAEGDLLRKGKITLPPGWGDYSTLKRIA
jgi:hypothetical protein